MTFLYLHGREFNMKSGSARIAVIGAALLLLLAPVYPSRSQTIDTPDWSAELVSAYPEFLTLIPPVNPIMTDAAAHDPVADGPSHLVKGGSFKLFGTVKADLDAQNPNNERPGVEARTAYAKLPISFVPNAGQLDPRVHYSAQSGGASFYFTTREAVFAFATKAKGLVLRLRFLGANPKPAITGQTPESGTVNYIIGNDPARWHTNLATYGELLYRDLWPGIDLLFRSENGQLQYEFLLRPGARAQDIQLAYLGARNLSVDGDGNLIIHTSLGSITDTRPVSYQLIDGKRVQVASRFALQRRSTYGFAVGSYDRTLPLIVDPGLVYSTYLGGKGDDSGYGIAVDSAGQAYVTGGTYSATDFPKTAGAYNTLHNGTQDVFVTKLNSSGSALVYSTYFGGSGDEPYISSSIAVADDGYAYVTGDTTSPDFPTTPGAFQTKFGGVYDAFVTKLKRDGSGLVYSTFLGGSDADGPDLGHAIAIDDAGHAYVTGFTYSTDFPTKNALQTAIAGVSNAYVAKFNSSGSGLVYSTYLGGTVYDVGEGIAVDGDGEAHVTGYTFSPDFPLKNAVQPILNGPADAFVTKLSGDGGSLVYSTFLGGSDFDAGGSISVDWSGNAYVTGDTYSANFPTTPGVFQPTFGGGVTDAFVTKLNRSGSALVYSTFLGGEVDDHGHDIAVDSTGQAYVTGFTNSTMFPTTADAFDRTYNGAGPPWFYGDAFVTKLNSHGSALVYSTYLGGSLGDDLGLGIAVGRSRKVYVTGSTNSMYFPTTPGAFDPTYNGAGPPYLYGDAFVTKLDVPAGEAGCDKADGDGEAVEQTSGRKSGFHFHKKSSCPDPSDSQNESVQAENDGSGPHFQSTSVTSATYTVADQNQAVTMIGAGVHNGLPVSFTMLAVNYGDVAPGVFQITLTDGYSFAGSVVSGGINIW